jgi:GYF domain 2/Domain of unknown function (DUF4190)
MFKIIGADGKQYGPVTVEQIRQWLAEGRARAETLVQAEGSTDWKPLGQFPEFATTAPAGVVPPSIPPASSLAPAVRSEQNKMALTGFVLGIMSVTIGLLCCGPLFGILGIIFSSIGLSQIGRDPVQTGKNLAVWGLLLSILGVMLGIGCVVLFGLGRGLGRPSFYWHYRN